MQLAGLGLRLGTSDELGFREGKKIAEFGRVQKILGRNRPRVVAAQVSYGYGGNSVGRGFCAFGRMLQKDSKLPVAEIRREHVVQHRERDTGLVCKPRNQAITRIQHRLGAGSRGQWVICTIIGPHTVTIFSIALRASEVLDPGVLIGGNRLAGELAAEPVRFLRQDDAHAVPQRCYFGTLQGWVSVVPTVATLFDSAKGWLPIAAVIKPWVYVLIILLTLFNIWLEVSQFVEIGKDSVRTKGMRKRATFHMAAAVALIALYWIMGEIINAFTPEDIVLRTLELFALAVLLALVFAEVSRAFAILALTTEPKLSRS